MMLNAPSVPELLGAARVLLLRGTVYVSVGVVCQAALTWPPAQQAGAHIRVAHELRVWFALVMLAHVTLPAAHAPVVQLPTHKRTPVSSAQGYGSTKPTFGAAVGV